jgi:hypothetical protein
VFIVSSKIKGFNEGFVKTNFSVAVPYLLPPRRPPAPQALAPLVTSMESRNLLQNKKTPELVEKGVSYKIRRLLNIFLRFKQGDYKIMRLLSNRLEL